MARFPLSRQWRLALFPGLALLGALGVAGEPPPLPQGDAGLAAKYPRDVGIEKDPAVLFVENFESPDIKGVKARWTEASDKAGKVLSLSGEVPVGSAGRQSLLMTATRGENTGGHLWKLFKPGVDAMYARFYVKFAADHPYIHHFVKIGAWKDSPNWPQGEAGKKHDGRRSFQTGIEPGSGWGRFPPPGRWFVYTYWQEMRSFDGGKSYYGNGFAPQPEVPAARGRWQCVEFMVKANSAPDRPDGEQAFWIDGQLCGRWAPGTPTGQWVKDHFDIGPGKPFEGFRWRADAGVKINTFWLLYYLFTTDRINAENESWNRKHPDDKINTAVAKVWFDDIVVAREYIGPRAEAAARPVGPR